MLAAVTLILSIVTNARASLLVPHYPDSTIFPWKGQPKEKWVNAAWLAALPKRPVQAWLHHGVATMQRC